MGLVIFWTEVIHGLVFTDQPGPAVGEFEQGWHEGETVQPMTSGNDHLERVRTAALEDIVSDRQPLEHALARGRSEFARACAQCHGPDGTGGAGYPDLTDDDWLWGGNLEAIETTIRYGIRSDHEDTRYTEMSAFLSDGILNSSQIDSIAEYVLSMSGGGNGRAAAGAGAQLFLQHCAVCHGREGQGNPEIGAPRLNDDIWLYGADMATVVETISYARNAAMPYWVGKLDDETIKSLSVYVYSLGGQQ